MSPEIQTIGPLKTAIFDALQGYAVLVLRKAMFGREVLSRIASLHGLFNLLVAERALRTPKDCDSFLNFSSEASCSQHEPVYSRKGVDLFQEMKGLLCRCLLQQVKSHKKQ